MYREGGAKCPKCDGLLPQEGDARSGMCQRCQADAHLRHSEALLAKGRQRRRRGTQLLAGAAALAMLGVLTLLALSDRATRPDEWVSTGAILFATFGVCAFILAVQSRRRL